MKPREIPKNDPSGENVALSIKGITTAIIYFQFIYDSEV
jgi:hypothetical protein